MKQPSRLCYDGAPVSIASFDGMQEKTIILDGFSKTYSMTGWRLGYGVMPVWLADAVNTLMVNSNSCTASFTQRAGIAALEGPQDCVDHMAAEFRQRRDAVCAGLNTIPGFRCPLPTGAFYAFVNVEGTGINSKELADYLLNEAGVACLNGGAFGAHGERLYSFQLRHNSLPNLMEAVERIRKVSSHWSTLSWSCLTCVCACVCRHSLFFAFLPRHQFSVWRITKITITSALRRSTTKPARHAAGQFEKPKGVEQRCRDRPQRPPQCVDYRHSVRAEERQRPRGIQS